ncbi:MAG: hypothetical protein QUS12_10260, partial [Methanosarcina sp.]|nr:hypothetical protein [Methanosarcina sp.]
MTRLFYSHENRSLCFLKSHNTDNAFTFTTFAQLSNLEKAQSTFPYHNIAQSTCHYELYNMNHYGQTDRQVGLQAIETDQTHPAEVIKTTSHTRG